MNEFLEKEKKLVVEYRFEGGCLGPAGDNYVDGFCEFAKGKILSIEPGLVVLNVVPRKEKTLAEVQYKLVGRNLTRDQARKFFERFGKNIDDFEATIDDELVALVPLYMSQQS